MNLASSFPNHILKFLKVFLSSCIFGQKKCLFLSERLGEFFLSQPGCSQDCQLLETCKQRYGTFV